MKVLVTGSEGFIGKHLVRYLLKGHHMVFGYDLVNGNDILDYQELKSHMRTANAVIHLAAKRGVPESMRASREYTETNVLGSVNVMEAARSLGIKRVILASSSSCGENRSPYAASKLSMEMYASMYAKLGLDTVCLRYFNVFGPGQSADGDDAAVIPKFIHQAMRGEPMMVYGENRVRDFTYVDNVVSATIAAMEAANVPSYRQGPFEVGSGKPMIIDALATMINSRIHGSAGWKRGPERNGDARISAANPSPMRYAFGWEPDIGFDEGLERTIRWFEEQHAHAGTR